MPTLSELQKCRKACIAAYAAEVKEAANNWQANLQACKEALAAALERCTSDPDPEGCRAMAFDDFTDCVRTAAQLLSNQIESARLKLENCLIDCQLRYGNR